MYAAVFKVLSEGGSAKRAKEALGEDVESRVVDSVFSAVKSKVSLGGRKRARDADADSDSEEEDNEQYNSLMQSLTSSHRPAPKRKKESAKQRAKKYGSGTSESYMLWKDEAGESLLMGSASLTWGFFLMLFDFAFAFCRIRLGQRGAVGGAG